MLKKKTDREEQMQALMEVEPEYQEYLDKLNETKRRRIQTHITGMRHGLTAIAPRICPGHDKCFIIKHCPIPERDASGKLHLGKAEDYPVMQACLLEKFFLQQKLIDYVQHLDVNPNNPVEMSIVNELALIDLMKNRALMVLSTGDRDAQGEDFLRVDVAGFSESGQPLHKTTLHPAVDAIEKFEKRRERWLDRLMQTRKAQADMQAKQGRANDDDRFLAEMQKVRGLLEKLSEKEEVLDIQIPLEDED